MSQKNLKFWEGELKELKCRAERLLESLQPADIDLEMDVRELQQELSTVNVELEMQCEELQRARQQLEQSQQYLADIFEQTPVGYLIVNAEGLIRSSNQAAAELFGMKKELLQNQRLSAFIPPSHIEAFRRCFKKAKVEKSSQTTDVCFRIRHGATLEARMHFFHLRSAYENENVLVCALMDIGAELTQRRLEQERNQKLEERVQSRTLELTSLNETLRKEVEAKSIAQNKAEAASRVKAKFLAAMSHDIRTPLSGVSMAFQVLEEMGLNEEAAEIVRLGSDSTNVLLELINQVLDFSRLEAGALSLQTTIFQPIEHFNAAVEIIRKDVDRKGLSLEVEVHPEVPKVLDGDPLRFKQILLNLLSNAVKYTQEGTVFIALRKVNEDPVKHQACLEILVKDTGIGIPSEELPFIFEAFRQARGEDRSHIEGSGLGLAIVKELAEAMGGKVTIQSRLGQGTEVRCQFWMDGNSSFPLPGRVPEGKEGTSSAKQLSVLLVEDNRTNAKLLEMMLEKEGWETVNAFTGQEALDLIRRRDFDLILMDINLPDIMGNDVMKRVRTDEALEFNQLTPFIALTAYAMKDDKQNYLRQGFDGYISKPVEKALFFNEIQTVLETRTSTLVS